MTDLAERTRTPELIERTTPSFTPGHVPPEHLPPLAPHAKEPWPSNAKMLVVALVVLAVLGAIGTVIGFTSGDDGPTTEQELQATIDTMTTDRDQLVGQVSDLQAEIDATVAERDELVGQLAQLESTSVTLTAERDQLVADLADVEATLATLTVERDTVLGQVAVIEAALTAQALLTTRAVEERDVLAGLFPMRLNTSLDVAAAVGTYDIDYTQAYCDGFATCGTVPIVDEITIRQTTTGGLEMTMENYPTAGLRAVDGVLYAVFDSTTAVPACNGATRVARVTVTVFANAVDVADTGIAEVGDLRASMTVQAPETGSCVAGTALYAAQLTPQS